MEDDVISRSGFLNDIKKKVMELKSADWVTIEFSELGFIGKLFKTKDLAIFINFFLIFSNYKPVDLLNEFVYTTIACGKIKFFSDYI